MAFWGLVIKAGESKPVDVQESDIVLTIGNVALNNGAEGKSAKVWASVESEDGPQKVLLATLRTPHAEQAVLDISFPQDVTLSVEGSGEVHLAGLIAPADDGLDEDDAMYGGFPSDEEMGSGDDEDDEEGDEEDGSDVENDPRVQELGSDESEDAKPVAAKGRKPETKALPNAKKQKTDAKKPAAAEKPTKAAKEAKPAAASAGIAGLKCTTCDKAFNNPAGLDQHMKAKHGAGGDAKPAAGPATPAKAAPATPKPAAAAPKTATPKAATPKAAPKPAGTPKAATPKGSKK